MEPAPKITCIVPTYNRPLFLRRLFAFYQQIAPPFSFIVVDSSQPNCAAENYQTIKQVAQPLGPLRIDYQHSELDFLGKCEVALEQVKSPYVVLCADDDFLIPQTVQVCSQFLQEHPDYSTAQGLTTIARRTSENVSLRLTTTYAIRQNDALARCRRLGSCWFSNFYAVFRTSELAELFRLTASHFDWPKSFLFPEQFLSQLSVLRGKVHVHNVLGNVWQRHSDNTSFGPKVADRFSVHTIYSDFRNHLVAEMTRHGVDRMAAFSFVDRTFIELCETDDTLRQNNRTVLRRVQRFINRTSRQARNLLLHEGVVCPRALRPCDTQAVSREFELAIQMIARYPNGMECMTERASAA